MPENSAPRMEMKGNYSLIVFWRPAVDRWPANASLMFSTRPVTGWLYYRFGNRIEGVFNKIDRMADKADRKKQRKREEQNSDLRAEVDRILDKVNKEGMHALTDDERSFLKKASKKLGS